MFHVSRRWPTSPWAAALAVGLALLATGPRPARAVFLFDTSYDRVPSVTSAARLMEADLDGDGRTELVTIGSANQLVVHRRLAGGGLSPPEPLLTFSNVLRCATIGDLNGDGRPDVLVVDAAGNAYSQLNNGDGTFGPTRPVLSLFTGELLALADLDADGRPELVAVGIFGPIILMKGQGDGSFQLVGTIATPGGVWAIALNDLDGDTRPDLLAAYDSYGGSGDIHAVLFYRGVPGLTFAPPVTCVPDVSGVQAIRVADLDRDGLMDAVIVRPGTVSTILYGSAAATPTRRLDVGVPVVAEVSIRDFDADGALDLAFTTRNAAEDGVVFLQQQASGGFLRVADCAGGASPSGLAFFDAVGDDLPDLVVANPGTSSLVVLKGRGGFKFGGETEVALNATGWDVAAGDLNRDGLQDIVVSTGWSPDPRTAALLGRGDCTFDAPVFGPITYPLGRIGLGDLNGDGTPDVVGTASYSYEAYAMTGDGTGQFVIASRTRFTLPWSPTDHFDLAVADFDEDGMDDVVFAVDGALVRYLGSSSGALVSPLTLSTTKKCVVTSDLDRDGHVDIVATNSMLGGDFGSDVYVYLGHGDGSFTALPSFYAGYKPALMVARDVTRDGIPDLVVYNWGENAIVTLRGVGNGTFVLASTLAGVAPRSMDVADCDGDGNPDLLTSSTAYASVDIRPGLGNGAFGDPERFGCRNYLDVIRCVDLDGDHLPEVVVGHHGRPLFTVLRNRGIGAPTPVVVSRVEAFVNAGRVRLVWHCDVHSLESSTVQRGVAGEWRDVGFTSTQGGDALVFQEDVEPGQYDYRLLSEQDGRRVPVGLVHVVVPSHERLAIGSCAWDPAASGFRLRLDLPGTAPADVAVFDVSGRIVGTRRGVSVEEANQPVTIRCDLQPSPGIYWVRVEQAGKSTSARVALTR